MHIHQATIKWVRKTEGFQYKDYNRTHIWQFDNGSEIAASAAPAFLGSEACIDPEEAFVASIASCHMLTFLAIAARNRITVNAYSDDAKGFMDKNADNKLAILRVELKPQIEFELEGAPTRDELAAMHELAHGECFIANSVNTKIEIVSS